MLMPATIASWFTVTSRPRSRGGDSSAMYIGEVIAARPTPTPPTARQTLNSVIVRGRAVPIAEAMKQTAATASVARRPILSASHIPTSGPAIDPKIALLIASPSPAASSPNCSFRKGSAPLAMERSNPNRNPPAAATRATRNT